MLAEYDSEQIALEGKIEGSRNTIAEYEKNCLFKCIIDFVAFFCLRKYHLEIQIEVCEGGYCVT